MERRYFEEIKKMSFEEFTRFLFGNKPEWYQWIASAQIWVEDGGDPTKSVIPSWVKFPRGITEEKARESLKKF